MKIDTKIALLKVVILAHFKPDYSNIQMNTMRNCEVWNNCVHLINH